MTIRRLKTYPSSQGYVYSYSFAGKRPAEEPGADEYIFDVTSDLRTTNTVGIIFPINVAAAWADAHGRTLSDAEQFAAAKLRLFRAFDEEPDMRSRPHQVCIDLPFLEESLASLGVD